MCAESQSLIKVVPAILTDDPAQLTRLLDVLKTAGETRVHLDIMDDTLVAGRTVSGWEQLAGHDVGVTLDVHLMVARPDEHMARWTESRNIGRFIAHVEADADLERLSLQCARQQDEFWAAISPDTPLGRLTGLSCHLDGAMFMTVVPGAQGRVFRPDVLDKVRLLRAERDVAVMVDGGITPATAPQCAAAGVAHLVSGSFVVKSADPAAALAELRASITR